MFASLQLHVCFLMQTCTHRPRSSSAVTHSREPPSWWVAPSQHPDMLFSPRFLWLPLCRSTPTQSESQRNSAPGGLRTTGHRAIFSWGRHKHTRPTEDLPLTGGNHGNWHQTQGPVSGYPWAQNHARVLQTPEEQQRQRCWHLEGNALFRGGPLIDWWKTERLFLSDASDEC